MRGQKQLTLRYEPGEDCPPSVAAATALQIFIPNTIGLIMLAALVVRASGEHDVYMDWVIFAALVVTGASMVLHSFRFRYLGAGRLIVTNFNVPFLAVCALALQAGGPSLLASLLVASTLVQFVLTLRLASLRRVFTPVVSGVVIMLVAVSAVPYILSSTVVVPEGESALRFLLPGAAALAIGVVISMNGTPLWRMWILPVMAAVGLVVAIPMGYYDFDIINDAPWVSLPVLSWPGLDLTFDQDFWSLLPVFVFVNLTAFMKAVGDVSVVCHASHRKSQALDYRAVQGGLSVYGLGTLFSGLLGTLPVAAPWSATVVYIGFTGVAAGGAGMFLGLLTMVAAPFTKLLALLVAIPSPVASAVYVIIFGMLFFEGARSVFKGELDQKKATIIGVAVVSGLSAGFFSGIIEGISGQLVGNTIVVGGFAAISMTIVSEIWRPRMRKLRVELSQSSLTPVDEFLSQFADRHSWSEASKNRLRLVGEELMLSLMAEESSTEAGQNRRLVAAIRHENGAAELEFVIATDDATKGNIENRMAYLDVEQALLAGEDDLSVRLLRQYASSVSHRQYYGIDIVSCRVEQ